MNSKPVHPNILVIVTDQHRYDAVSALGETVCQTPNIDSLAENGVSFTQAYSISALCTPARASLYSGLYPHRHGLIRNSEDPYCKTEFSDSQQLLPFYFSQAGYRCGFEGKWHCGIERLPADFGFEGMNVSGYGNCTLTDEYQAYLRKHNLKQGAVDVDGGGWQRNIALC